MTETHVSDGDTEVRVPDAIVDAAIDSVGRYFEPLNGVSADAQGRDHVNAARYRKNIEALDRAVPIRHKKVLEIGSGFGISLAIMLMHFDADAYGLEPASEGFGSSFGSARVILEANGLDTTRIIDAVGESIPFPDATFDVVYSNNVLEHTTRPERVLEEAFRVLKPGGRLFVEVPNYLAYFEGHYFVPQPPILWNGLLAFWVERVFRRDPAFARTLRTQINPIWMRRTLRRIGKRYPLQLETLGEKQFLARMANPIVFQTDALQSNAGRLVRVMQRLNAFNWIGRTMVALQAHYPIVMIANRSQE